MAQKHKWAFSARFRKNAFGWRSSALAVQRIREAVAEIKKTARRDPILAADGIVVFLEKVSPALAHVDSSSGALGTAVNTAIDKLVPIIAKAPASGAMRDQWLARLWQAVEEDDIPYIEALPDYWGDLCASAERAEHWADEFLPGVRMALSPDPELRGYYVGTAACLSALLAAKRYADILALLNHDPHKFWHYRKWGVKALLASGKKAAALRFAEDTRGLNQPDQTISEACEEILLASGLAEEAYRRYGIEANQRTTYLATFRAILKKYPKKAPAEVLQDLVDATPGSEGKWFAAAKSANLYDEAIRLANQSPCDPRTLTRAARDMREKNPGFAAAAGMAALRWLTEGYGYDITGVDVRAAYDHTMAAAENAGTAIETGECIRKMVAAETFGDRFVARILGPALR